MDTTLSTSSESPPDLRKLNISPTIAEPSSSTNEDLPPHRSHDPSKNLKRSDPFQFGSRYLLEDDDVFEFNAWDHVETDDDYKRYAESQYAKQREKPVSDFDKSMVLSSPPHIYLSCVFSSLFGSCNSLVALSVITPYMHDPFFIRPETKKANEWHHYLPTLVGQVS